MLKRFGFLSFVVGFGILCTGCAGGSKALDVDAAESADNPTEQIFGQRVIGRTLELKAGEANLRGRGASDKISIELHSDGTSDVKVVAHIYRNFGETSPTTRTSSGKGHWWIKENLFCHGSSNISYGTRDCYRISKIEKILKFYYDDCTFQSSPDCKAGQVAWLGSVN